eukprot:5792661-Prymnesium_polylepis.1
MGCDPPASGSNGKIEHVADGPIVWSEAISLKSPHNGGNGPACEACDEGLMAMTLDTSMPASTSAQR